MRAWPLLLLLAGCSASFTPRSTPPGAPESRRATVCMPGDICEPGQMCPPGYDCVPGSMPVPNRLTRP